MVMSFKIKVSFEPAEFMPNDILFVISAYKLVAPVTVSANVSVTPWLYAIAYTIIGVINSERIISAINILFLRLSLIFIFHLSKCDCKFYVYWCVSWNIYCGKC